ncbi:MAG TPA: hypothetical protein VM658_01200 [bacterium]|nr:hypothetical protein [bacterium]
MTENGDRLRYLKIIMAAGGGYEMFMGLTMIFFIGWFFRLLGAGDEIRYQMFPGSVGVLAVCFGLLLLLGSRDPERYLLVALVSILLRVLIQVPIITGCLQTPELTLPLIGFGAFDLAFAALTAHAIRASGIDWEKF